jgi:formylglycine-generating enzyme required for sulfatase activity
LPTQAEWENAARAGITAARYGKLDDIAWYGDYSGDRRIDSTTIWRQDEKNYSPRMQKNGNGPKPVARKLPNTWGLYDTVGNVWQWVADWYGETYYESSPKRDPRGPSPGLYRVLRGGSWLFPSFLARVSYRHRAEPNSRQGFFVGFRCAGQLP